MKIFADALHRYIREMKARPSGMGVSHQKSLEKAARLPLGEVPLAELESKHFTEFAILMSKDHGDYDHDAVQPQTITAYFSKLNGVVNMLQLWKIPRAKEIRTEFDDARLWLEHLHLDGKGRPREQRISPEQEKTIKAYYTEQELTQPKCAAPMVTIIDIALLTLRRQSEITRLAWADFEQDTKMLTVRDMKDPKVKIGNHFRFPLIRGAFEIIMAQPREGALIFPYNAHSISQRWTQAMQKLGYPIHFHDLRREGICRMFEEGFSAEQVAGVSGHKNWNTLARTYANKFDPMDLHNGPRAGRVKPVVEMRIA